MASRLFRIKDELDGKAKAYAERLGISVNALFVIAVSEYLEARNSAQVRPMEKPVEPRQIEEPPVIPPVIPADDFKLTPSPPARKEAGKTIEPGRAIRRTMERMAKKPGKPKRF